MLHKLNEAFDKKFCETKELKEASGIKVDLLNALKRAREALKEQGNNNLKAYEIAYQGVIEDFFPEKSWWEVTDTDIFMDLFNNRDPEHTEIEIVKNIKDEYLEEDLWHMASPITGAIVDMINGKKESLDEETEEITEDGLLSGNTINISPNLSANVEADVHDVSTGDIASAGLDVPKLEGCDTKLEEKFQRGFKFNNAGFEWEVLDTNGDYTLVYAKDKEFHPYVVAWLLNKNRDDDEYSWSQGHYFQNERDAEIFLDDVRYNESLKEGCHKDVDESIKTIEEIDLEDFDFWGPAEEVFELLTDDERSMAQDYIEEMYPDGIGKTELNDIFAYDDDFILSITGLEDIDNFYDRRK